MADKENKKKAPKKVKPKDTRTWRERTKLVTLLSAISMVMVLVASSFAGYMAFKILHRNKLRDAWALSFLELERIGNRCVDYLEAASGMGQQDVDERLRQASTVKLPDVVFRFDDGNQLTKMLGKGPDKLPMSELGLTEALLRNRLTVMRLAGEDYVAGSVMPKTRELIFNTNFDPGNYLLLWKINFVGWMRELPIPARERTRVYVVTSHGKVLYTSDPSITDLTYVKRQLVQKFIAAPIPTGELELNSVDVPSYGYFYQIPKTNVVMFVETPKELVLAEITAAENQYALYLVALIFVLLIVTLVSLRGALAPVAELVALSKEIARGNFQVAAKSRGFGELNQLIGSFLDMSKSLIARDEEIMALAEEQKDKVRLEGELALAKNIQETLLPREALTIKSGIEVATQYIPASEVAGDWYNFCYSEATGESILVIADVSGHGAGAAMYTAMIAAEFEQVRQSQIDGFPVGEFLTRINSLILTFGKGKWSASVLVARFVKGSKTIDLFNCGHPFPLMAYPKEWNKKNETISMRSDILGLITEPKISETTVDFPKGACLLLFTDGLVELGGVDNKVLSDRKLAKMVEFTVPTTARQVVAGVYDAWLGLLKGQKASDDLCLMALRAAA
jgi:serine phosphatase RsbU (regulator of sigma subunit)